MLTRLAAALERAGVHVDKTLTIVSRDGAVEIVDSNGNSVKLDPSKRTTSKTDLMTVQLGVMVRF